MDFSSLLQQSSLGFYKDLGTLLQQSSLVFTRICELCYNKVRLDFTPKDLHVPVPATEGRVSRVSYSKTVNIDYRYFRTRMHNLFSSL